MSTQPILPPPVRPSDVERAYIEEQPGGMWPDNQDSNFGAHRKVFCDMLQVAVDQLQTLYNEKFPDTSVRFINFHEEQMGLPINPPGRSLLQRQQSVKARYTRGPFTRTLRRKVIESYISAALGGVAPAFGTSGITIGPGIPLYSGVSGDVKIYYLIYENISNFSYKVYIDSRVTPDFPALSRDLDRITPAGISYTYGVLYNVNGGGKAAGKGRGTHP